MEINTFDEIKHYPLKTYNRAVTSFNLMDDFGQEVCKAYMGGFSEQDKKALYVMISFIKTHGRDAAMKAATKSLELEDGCN